jgi:hypothetical protein
MKAYGEVDILVHVFFTFAVVGGEWSTSRPDSFTPGERATSTRFIGGLVGPEPIWRIPGGENSCAYGASASDPSVVLHLVSCYTDCANPLEVTIFYFINQMVEQRGSI